MFYLEIGPLQEFEYTGISNVVCNLAAEFLKQRRFEVTFFADRREIPRELVVELVATRTGKGFTWMLRNCAFPAVSALAADPSVGIFGNAKTGHFLFDYEAQIIHDLSTFVTPEFHNSDTIQFHTETLLGDLVSNDLNICVSEATKSDLMRFFPEIPGDRHLVAPPGWDWPSRFAELYDTHFAGREIRPFILVLGTLEPRKNIDLVLSFLRDNRSILELYQFVFAGRYGWGPKTAPRLKEFGLADAVETGRIVFPGFVGEFTKYAMLRNAAVVVYPSLFEGFGLPVVEALSLGKPVVTTASSSLPEVGGDAVTYFHPFAPGSFERALFTTLSEIRTDSARRATRAKRQAELFSWHRFCSSIVDRIVEDLATDEPAASSPDAARLRSSGS
jgi:glycosyltransferase involved in cell wall biosynthesis